MHQWFSAGNDLPPEEHLAMSGNIFSVPTKVVSGGFQARWMKAKDIAPSYKSQSSTLDTKIYPTEMSVVLKMRDQGLNESTAVIT